MAELTVKGLDALKLISYTTINSFANFKPNKAPGIFFDNKLDYATWFSAEKYCIHDIQMIPNAMPPSSVGRCCMASHQRKRPGVRWSATPGSGTGRVRTGRS